MKQIIITALLLFAYPVLADTTAQQLAKLQDNTCFVFVYTKAPSHSWEIGRENTTLPWVMIEKDSAAIRIAQPSSFCEENSIPLKECNYYWDRTIELKDDWLRNFSNFIVVKCPTKLEKQNLKKLLR